MIRLLTILVPVFGLVFGLAACSSPNPTLYTAAMVPGTPHAGGPAVVVVREVSLARYLQRSQIVRSSENYRLDVMSNDWWGEPLGAMLTRLLVQELGQRLPASTVYGENGAVSTSQDATVELNIERLDENVAGNLVLNAQSAVVFEKRRTTPVTQSMHFVVTPPQPTLEGQVAAMSTAMGQVADRLAHALRR